MSIPFYIKTEWNSKGAAIVKISDLNCAECQKEWFSSSDGADKRGQKITLPQQCCVHSKYITCYMSTLNVWEYERKTDLPENETTNDVNLDQKQTALNDCIWRSWEKYWSYHSSYFSNLAWIYRFPNLVDESSLMWLKEELEKFPYLENHLQYYGDIPLISEKKLEEVDCSEIDEYNNVLNDMWLELNLKRTYIQLRLFLWVIDCPLNKKMENYFEAEGITEDPSSVKQYDEIVSFTISSKNSFKCRKKVNIAGVVIEYTSQKYKDSYTSTNKEFTSHLEDIDSHHNSNYTSFNNERKEFICIDEDVEVLDDRTKLDSNENPNSKTNLGITEISDSEINVNKPEDSLNVKEIADSKIDNDMLDPVINFDIKAMSDQETNIDKKEMSNPETNIDKEMSGPETSTDKEWLDPETNVHKKNISDQEILDKDTIESGVDIDKKELLNPEINTNIKESSDPEINANMKELSDPEAIVDKEEMLDSETNVDNKISDIETNESKLRSDSETNSNIKKPLDSKSYADVMEMLNLKTDNTVKEPLNSKLNPKLWLTDNDRNHLKITKERENVNLKENLNNEESLNTINETTQTSDLERKNEIYQLRKSKHAAIGVSWALKHIQQKNMANIENSSLTNGDSDGTSKSSGNAITKKQTKDKGIDGKERTLEIKYKEGYSETNGYPDDDNQKEFCDLNQISTKSCPKDDPIEEQGSTQEISDNCESDPQSELKNLNGSVPDKPKSDVSVSSGNNKAKTLNFFWVNACMNLISGVFKNYFASSQPWYVLFSPFWWFGYGLDKEMVIEKKMKKVEKKSLGNFITYFKPTIRKQCLYPSLLSAESLHVTKVTKSEDFREPYKNLIKIRLNYNKKSDSSKEVVVRFMSEEDIDYEYRSTDCDYPYDKQCNEEVEASENFATSCEDEDNHTVDSELSATKEGEGLDESVRTSDSENWLYKSNIIFDENGDHKAEPLSNKEATLCSKMNTILRNYSVMRLSNDDNYYRHVPKDLPENLAKYYLQRYRLFLKYDENIKLDYESWFSVTPEMIAAHQAVRCTGDIVVDAFCGAGGNAIQLAFTCHRVFAIDIDPKKIELARHNSRIYGVEDRIEFIQGDFFQLAPSLKADVVLLSPPWGGVDYNKETDFDVLSLGGSMDCKLLFDTAKKITPNIALYVPKSSNLLQLIELAGLNGKVDIEFNHISNKRKSITAYYGDLADYSEEDVSQ